MNQKKTDVKLLAQMALLVALELVLAFTPLGYIPLGFMNATTMHIPVILGACLLGPKAGALLGGVFGVTSVIRATITPNLTSFVFTPFYSFSPEFSGNWTSLIVAIVPRVLIGVIAGLVFQFVMRVSHDKQAVALPIAMGNANDAVKAICKRETLTNAEDGVAAAIDRILAENE